MSDKLFDRSWLDVVKFNMHEMSAGQVAVHIWKRGHTCTLTSVTSAQLQDPNFPLWITLRDRAVAAWAKQNPVDETVCVECGGFLRNTKRMWHGKSFCLVCGTPVL